MWIILFRMLHRVSWAWGSRFILRFVHLSLAPWSSPLIYSSFHSIRGGNRSLICKISNLIDWSLWIYAWLLQINLLKLLLLRNIWEVYFLLGLFNTLYLLDWIYCLIVTDIPWPRILYAPLFIIKFHSYCWKSFFKFFIL